jgi:hypothetical protein
MPKRNRLFGVSLLLAGLLAACASSEQDPGSYDPEREARIRVFHGPSVYIYLGNICDGRSHPVIHAAVGGFSYAARNRRIGMPVAEDTPRSFHEYAIPAGKPVTVRLHWQAQNASGSWEHCGPTHLMFTPQAGQDYEAFMRFRGGACQGAESREMEKSPEGAVSTMPAPLNALPFRSCGSW